MQYVVLAGDREVALDVEADAQSPGGTFQVSLGEESFAAHAVFLADGAVSLLLDGEHFLVRPTADGAVVRGQFVPAEVLDLRTLALRRAQARAGGEDGPADVKAPMAGRVARVLAENGQQVEAGTPLLIIEAMKMENEVQAPKTGVLRGLSYGPEALVELGAVVCRVE
jgi:biotin carboxyl carrier protein